MRLIGRKILEKLKRKNKGNIALSNAIDNLIKEILENEWKNPFELKKVEMMLIVYIVMVSIFSISRYTGQ